CSKVRSSCCALPVYRPRQTRQGSELRITLVSGRQNGAHPSKARGRGRLLVIVPLTQKPDAMVMGLTKRVKARAARSLALTRLLKPARCSQFRGVCRGLSRMAQPPRSGATQWHPLQTPTDTQQLMQHFGRHSRHQSASQASFLLSSRANL
ncbi:MAG: hypothetical protein RLZZ157_828, partial [Pseudomonadota bacterium]